ncbi:D-glycero-beta-D-manno-heptose 1-phosphate adenylyltransferase [Butyricimonas faecalis]|jgi:D-glycero-beta-D-manno-heptose 1-phosphate adenylyltransferase|uniref:D-glycero-beta-D-manno-heptose 1-phosphate adenylyltransferase n=1 Tax=Butyricimonas faecalis TaxID=2093856 RepID=A0A3Q9IUP6_9BACT|nr:D-glycero-beta-D-manno-heptose 1-phosphate adenylyltransferase [Butyricimonas faecalis]AZS30383.1 D-glycero-beta-D-manno-heptose 1-phosphate adenylyltransferase [Butyricimonas faecalis]
MDYLPFIEKKIAYTAKEAENTLSLWRFKDDKIVFTNGCFDILHKGHIEYLAKAASLGTKLVIGLNTDASVKRLKGDSRPVNDENARALLLASLVFVDKVILFDTDTPRDLIDFVQPDVLVKGGDYKPEEIVGYDIVKAKGGEIVTLDFVEGYSTTSLIEKMK